MIPTHPLAEPTLHEDWRGASRICSCVLLLDLERLRNVHLLHSQLYTEAENKLALAPKAVMEWWGPPQYINWYTKIGLGVSTPSLLNPSQC